MVLGQDEGGQIRDGACDCRSDAGNPIAREQQRPQPRAEGEVRDDGDVIVREVDGVLVLSTVGASIRAPHIYARLVVKGRNWSCAREWIGGKTHFGKS